LDAYIARIANVRDGRLSKLPGENFYSVGYIEGTALCHTAKYFEVVNGRARQVGTPPGFNGDGGSACLADRSFGRLDDVPVFFQERYDFTPYMWAYLTVATWNAGRFVGELGASAGHFTDQMLVQRLVQRIREMSAVHRLQPGIHLRRDTNSELLFLLQAKHGPPPLRDGHHLSRPRLTNGGARYRNRCRDP
jgi:hypothetical protein